MTNVIDVSYYFVSKSQPGTISGVANLKLQKLLYYAQGFHYAFYNKKLFDDPIFCFRHGPVVKQAYQHFRDHNVNSIPKRSLDFSTLPKEVIATLDQVWAVFGERTGSEMERQIKSEAPWIEAKAGLPEAVLPEKPMDVQKIAEYFKEFYIIKK